MAVELKDYVLKLKGELENLLGCPIEIVEDANSSLPVKMEYAHNYARDRHVIRANWSRCANCYPVFAIMLQTKLQLKRLEGRDGYGVLQPVSTAAECQSFADMVRSDKKGQELLRKCGPTRFDGLVEQLRVGLVTQATRPTRNCSTSPSNLVGPHVRSSSCPFLSERTMSAKL